jgi:branched-subunit amino acid transport protein
MTEMDTITLWSVLVAAGLCTYFLRLSFIVLLGRGDEIPDKAEIALEYVPPAVLAALVAPALVYVDGTVALSVGNPRLLAGGVAMGVAWKTKNVAATIGVGIVTLWILQLL